HPLLLASRVLLDAEDADGVAQVQILCGTTSVATFRAPPYDATIDFSGCLPFVTAPAASGTLPTITLHVVATDTLGHSTEQDLHTYFDTTLPVITTTLPQYVRSG